LQPCSITPLIRPLVAALIVAGLATTSIGAGQDGTAPGGVLARLGGWTEAPQYVELFAPPSQRVSYRAYVSARPLAAALASLAQEPSLLDPPGAWTSRSLGARDAFGESGRYNRWDLARLYVSTPVLVARGPREERGRVVESWMLFSPYPDSKMSALEQGTLLLVVPVAPL
jgi:hypothetical protein